MVNVCIVVREFGNRKPEYSLEFQLPEVPQVGSYISINRADIIKPRGEDLIVRKVWWMLHHPDAPDSTDSSTNGSGSLIEIFVECDKAIGPYATKAWREAVETARKHGIEVEKFDVSRKMIME